MKFIACLTLLALVACNQGAPNPVAVQLQDGRLLFGDLQGTTLCKYFQPIVTKDKDGKQTVTLQPGGSNYGGTGCLTIKESILTTEPLTASSQVYTSITGSVASAPAPAAPATVPTLSAPATFPPRPAPLTPQK